MALAYQRSNYSLGQRDPTDIGSKHLKQRMAHFYQSSYTANAAWWAQANIDKRFKAGDQTLWSLIYGENQFNQSRRYFFNLIRRHINMIVGFQRKNRKSTVTIPSDEFDQLSDDYNKTIKWTDDRNGFQEYFSQAFEDAVDVGKGLLHIYPDYTLDPISGDYFCDKVGFSNYLMDPYSRKQDLTDCNFIWRRRWVSKECAVSLMPGREEEIMKLMPVGTKDGKFPLQAELVNANLNDLLCYDEFHYLDSREGTIIIDPKTGESTQWEEYPGDPEDLLELTLRQQPWLITKKVRIPTVKLGVTINDKVFYDGENLLSIDQYPFVPLVCYDEPDLQIYQWRNQGVIRNLRDAQYLYNRRKVIELEILESQINNGWIYPVDVVTDAKAFRQSGPGGFLIPLKAGRLPNEIQRVEAPGIPQSMMELSASLAEDITKISGVNEELLGAATDDKSGILSMLRQGAGLTTLQTIFDKADYSQRLYGKIMLQTIRKNFSRGKITSILGHEPDPRFFTSHSQKYGITVEEGNYSATQRQTELQQLLYFKEIGMNIPDKSIMRAAIITNKKQVMQEIEEANQQQAQAEQMQAQVEQQKAQADIMMKNARAQSDLARQADLMASSQEKYAKIEESQANSEYKRTEADLNLVKTMVELEDMDLENFRKALELAQVIKDQNKIESNTALRGA